MQSSGRSHAHCGQRETSDVSRGGGREGGIGRSVAGVQMSRKPHRADSSLRIHASQAAGFAGMGARRHIDEATVRTRPGEGKAYRHCSEWLAVTQEGAINLDTHVLPKWACEKMLHSARVALREMNNPTIQIGDIKGYEPTGAFGTNVIVVDGPKIHKGEASYDVLKDGNVVTIAAKKLRKRLKK